jgi:NADP-dependent aldehyde dehydrogenase
MQFTAPGMAQPKQPRAVAVTRPASGHELVDVLAQKAGRVLWNQWPTGVSVTYAQQHGGPYPATTAPGSTSVGTAAIERFMRPVAYQNFPQHLLPAELCDLNSQELPRLINGLRVP